MDDKFDLVSVSYTHLDVYKRQVEFNSIINQPNSAILSVGAIIEKPVVKNGQIVVGNTMMLSLACDHRTICLLYTSRCV